jgi:hypothetical protein
MFSIEPFEGTSICCIRCMEWFPEEDWEETFIWCDICYEHDAIRCPLCEYTFDFVLSREVLLVKWDYDANN